MLQCYIITDIKIIGWLKIGKILDLSLVNFSRKFINLDNLENFANNHNSIVQGVRMLLLTFYE